MDIDELKIQIIQNDGYKTYIPNFETTPSGEYIYQENKLQKITLLKERLKLPMYSKDSNTDDNITGYIFTD
jgi:hypothetical protein